MFGKENGVRFLPVKQETTQINETHLCFLKHLSSFKLKN